MMSVIGGRGRPVARAIAGKIGTRTELKSFRAETPQGRPAINGNSRLKTFHGGRLPANAESRPPAGIPGARAAFI